jgi:hypothetical protein
MTQLIVTFHNVANASKKESRCKVRLLNQHKWTDIPVARNSAARINLFASLDYCFNAAMKMLAIEKKIRFCGAKVLEIAFYFLKITPKTATG